MARADESKAEGSPERDRGDAAVVSEAAAEAVLDTLAGLLRTLGDHAFDTGELDRESARRDFEAWARHARTVASRTAAGFSPTMATLPSAFGPPSIFPAELPEFFSFAITP